MAQSTLDLLEFTLKPIGTISFGKESAKTFTGISKAAFQGVVLLVPPAPFDRLHSVKECEKVLRISGEFVYLFLAKDLNRRAVAGSTGLSLPFEPVPGLYSRLLGFRAVPQKAKRAAVLCVVYLN